MTAISLLLLTLSLVLCIPIAIFAMEVIIARPWKQGKQEGLGLPVPSVAVLVPAHNESSNILPTIQDVRLQLRETDYLLVIADNCVDDTAEVAKAAGATVIERHDLAKVGKGYALDWGLRHLRSLRRVDVVLIVDADCRLADGSIAVLAKAAALTGRPVQALNLVKAPEELQLNYQVAEFAWLVKNLVRPLGLARLGFPCQLMGTGMAFPWGLIQELRLATGHIVEDLKLGLDAALINRPPMFCPGAKVTSTFPTTKAAARQQRERWEHGHLELALRTAPKIALKALRRRDLQLLVLAADLAIPPLSFLLLAAFVAVTATGLAAFLGAGIAPFLVVLSGAILLLLAIGVAWFHHGRNLLPAKNLLQLAPYLVGKLGLYWRFLSRKRVSRWNRTDRS